MLVADRPTLLRLVLLTNRFTEYAGLSFLCIFLRYHFIIFLQVKKDYDDFLQFEKCLFLWWRSSFVAQSSGKEALNVANRLV